MGDDRRRQGALPIGICEKRRHDVGDEHEGKREEDALDALVRAADDEDPHGERRDGHRDVLRDAEHLHARRDARELRERRRDVADKQREHGKRGEANAEALADERREALARDRAHAPRAGFDDDEQNAHDGDDP